MSAIATGINDQGVVVGSYLVAEERSGAHGFMWKNGVFTNIEVPGAAATQPVKVSNSGDIVGTYVDAGLVEHGFAFDQGHFFTIDRPGFNETQLAAVNSFDNVLGLGTTGTGQAWFKGFCSAVF